MDRPKLPPLEQALEFLRMAEANHAELLARFKKLEAGPKPDRNVARVKLRESRHTLQGMRDAVAYWRRCPPEAGIAQPAVPPRGPSPMQGGAEAPLD